MDLSCYVAPWALPREGIPIHLIWKHQTDYDHILVNHPKDIEITEYYNVKNHHIVKDGLVKIESLRSPGFFGFVLATKNIFDNLHIEKEFTISFIKDEKICLSKNLKAHYYRPKIEIIDCPEIITLSDGMDSSGLVKVTMKLWGFGKVSMSTEFNHGGGFEANPESLYRELVGRLLSVFRDMPHEEQKEHSIMINKDWLEREVQNYADKLNNGELPLDINEHDLDDFKDWIGQPENMDTLKIFLSRQMENILIDSLLFYFDRFPTDEVELRQGSPEVHIKHATENLQIRFHYRDSIQNEYEPIEVSLKINDERSNKRADTKIPIGIRWIKERIVPEEEEVCE